MENVLKEIFKAEDFESLYRSIVDNSADFIYICDFDGNAIYLNRAAREYFRQKGIDWEKFNLFSIIHPDDIPIARESLKVKREEKQGSSLYVVRVKIGDEYRYYQINSMVIYRGGKPFAVQGIARDVGDLYRSQQELKERSRELRLLNRLSDFMMNNLSDPDKIISKAIDYVHHFLNCCAGAIYRVNWMENSATAVKRYGFAKKLLGQIDEIKFGVNSPWFRELMEKSVLLIRNPARADFPHIDVLQKAGYSNFLLALAAHNKIPYAIILVASREKIELSSDKMRAFKAMIKQIGTGIALSTTHYELVNSRDSLRMANQLWEGTFDVVKDAIIISDRDGNIIRANRSTARILGIENKELVGKNVFEYVLNWCTKCEEIFPKVLATGESYDFEVRLPASGRHLLVTISPIYRGTDIDKVLLVVKDVTELRRMWEELAQTQKLESIGFLASGISHNFNNVLMSIMGNLYQLESALGDQISPVVKEILKSIESAIDDASETIKQLLLFARAGEFKRQKFDTSALLREIEFLRKAFPSNIKINFHILTDNPWVMGDPGQIKQSLINLILNAKDAMPEGGTVDVIISRRRVREGEVPGLSPGEYVVITVKDTGVGIPPENLPRIFDPFFTTKKEGKGTGLGLSMVYRYITGMGGAIEVDSALGEGTKFDLYIPATTQPRPEPEPPNKKFESANLLLVEDDLTLNKLFKNYLTKEGYRVHSFRSAREALKFFEENQPDLAIVDTMLPDVSGDDLVWTIAKKFPRTPIIVISGKKPEAEIEKFLQSGRGYFLMKPFKLPTLSEKIQILIERRKKSPRWN